MAVFFKVQIMYFYLAFHWILCLVQCLILHINTPCNIFQALSLRQELAFSCALKFMNSKILYTFILLETFMCWPLKFLVQSVQKNNTNRVPQKYLMILQYMYSILFIFKINVYNVPVKMYKVQKQEHISHL